MKAFETLSKWTGTDGLLHFLVCYSVMLTIGMLTKTWIALCLTIALALAKEAWDYFVQKDNTIKDVLHDFICDAAGILGAIILIVIVRV